MKNFIEATFPKNKQKKMAILSETWIQQDREKRIVQGIDKGLYVRNQQVAFNILKENEDKNLISNVTDLSLDELSYRVINSRCSVDLYNYVIKK